MMKITMISYGDYHYESQLGRLKDTAIASGFFDDVVTFAPKDFDVYFTNHIYNYVKNQRGGGYWCWKPYIIKKYMDFLSSGDVLFYLDAGCTINTKATKRFNEYLEIVNSSQTGTLDFELPLPEYRYTKNEVFTYFNSPEPVKLSNQLMATVLIFKKCSHSESLVDKWYDTLMEDYTLFTDRKTERQHEEFIDHRHDQSIFSVIRKTFGANIVPDETYFTDFMIFGEHFPFWATRSR